MTTDSGTNDKKVATAAPCTKEKGDESDEAHRRFEVELEFVQCLASPSYLHFLAQNEYFENADFIAYLNYLQYWRHPRYAKFVVYPHALYFLQLLQDAAFRDAIKRDDYSLLVHQQQGWNWQFDRSLKTPQPQHNAPNDSNLSNNNNNNSTTTPANADEPLAST